MKKKIIIALSGGIDSSVASFILKKNKKNIEAIFMNNWKSESKGNCLNKIDYKNAIYISNLLKIKLNFIDFSNEYFNLVFKLFLNKLLIGENINPDIYCNKKIKFNILFNFLKKNLNADFLATGHYSSLKIEKKKEIFNSFDSIKDQTYFLNQINFFSKINILFPLMNYKKKEIRKIAKYNNLINFNKKDSFGICFIRNNNFFNFIKDFLKIKKGYIIDENNKIIGTHFGLHLYTIGQSTKLTIFNNKKKFYIFKKNIRKNILYVSNKKKNLFIRKIFIKNLNFIPYEKTIYYIKLKHTFNFNKCILKKNNKKYKLIFKKKEFLLSKGQHVSFYKNKICLGGGIITD